VGLAGGVYGHRTESMESPEAGRNAAATPPPQSATRPPTQPLPPHPPSPHPNTPLLTPPSPPPPSQPPPQPQQQIQEGKAEKAADAIKAMLSQNAKVRRNGEAQVIPAEELVPGDIVLLKSGDKVPADLRLITANNLQVRLRVCGVVWECGCVCVRVRLWLGVRLWVWLGVCVCVGVWLCVGGGGWLGVCDCGWGVCVWLWLCGVSVCMLLGGSGAWVWCA